MSMNTDTIAFPSQPNDRRTTGSSAFERYPRVRLLLSLAAASVVFAGVAGCGGEAGDDGSGDASNDRGSAGSVGEEAGEVFADIPEGGAAEAMPTSPVKASREDGGRNVVYAVRGRVTSLPEGMNDFSVRHEAIPEFISGRTAADGTPELGMNVMDMPFTAAERYDFGDVAVGDVVMIRFEVRYGADGSLEGYELVGHEVLPAETELDFTPLPGRGMPDGE